MQPSLHRGSHLQMEDDGQKLLERQSLLQETAKRHQHEELSWVGEHCSGAYSHIGWGCPHSPKELWFLRPRIIPSRQSEWGRPLEMPSLLHLECLSQPPPPNRQMGVSKKQSPWGALLQVSYICKICKNNSNLGAYLNLFWARQNLFVCKTRGWSHAHWDNWVLYHWFQLKEAHTLTL